MTCLWMTSFVMLMKSLIKLMMLRFHLSTAYWRENEITLIFSSQSQCILCNKLNRRSYISMFKSTQLKWSNARSNMLKRMHLVHCHVFKVSSINWHSLTYIELFIVKLNCSNIFLSICMLFSMVFHLSSLISIMCQFLTWMNVKYDQH